MKKTQREYPSISGRVSPAYKRRFDDVLSRLQERNCKIKAADLLRILIGAENKLKINPEEKAYLFGETSALNDRGERRSTAGES